MKERIKDSLEIPPEKTKIIFENISDTLKDFYDKLLAIKGYKSYSHKASISFLLKKGIDITAVSELENFRYKINDSKYYRLKITNENVKLITKFYSAHKEKIFNMLKEINLS